MLITAPERTELIQELCDYYGTDSHLWRPMSTPVLEQAWLAIHLHQAG